MTNRDIVRWAIEFEETEGREIGVLVAYTKQGERLTFEHRVWVNGEFHDVATDIIAEDPKAT